MNFTTIIGSLREDLIDRAANELAISERVVLPKTTAGREVFHIAVEHRDGHWGKVSEALKVMLTKPQRLLYLLPGGNIQHNTGVFQRATLAVPHLTRL